MSDFYKHDFDNPYRRLLNVPVSETEVMKVPYRRLSESDVYERIYPRIGHHRIDDYQDESWSRWLPRLLELQEAHELSEDDIGSLHECYQCLQDRSEFVEMLGNDVYKAFVMAGTLSIHPDVEDLDAVMAMDGDEMQYRYGHDDLSRVGAKDHARWEMRAHLSEATKFAIGHTALSDWGILDVSQFS